MDQRLIYNPEHYKTRLSAYAKDTIEYKSLAGLLKYKINKNGNDAVVEEINGQFNIYVSTKPRVSIVVTNYGRADYRTMFFAMVNIGKQIEIKVYWDKSQNLLYAILVVFALTMCVASHSPFFAIMTSLFAIGFLLYIRRAKKRYRRFILNFLNTIATS